jgi:hypothetical protein
MQLIKFGMKALQPYWYVVVVVVVVCERTRSPNYEQYKQFTLGSIPSLNIRQEPGEVKIRKWGIQ